MKTKFFIAICCTFVVLFGCSKTTTAPAKTAADYIVKTWNVQEVDGAIGTLNVTAYTKGAASNLIDFSKYQLVFTADGKYTQIDQTGSKTNGTYQLTNSNTTLVLTDAATSAIATWSINAASDTSLVLTHNIDGTNPSAFDTVLIQYAKGVGFDATKNSSLTVRLTP